MQRAAIALFTYRARPALYATKFYFQNATFPLAVPARQDQEHDARRAVILALWLRPMRGCCNGWQAWARTTQFFSSLGIPFPHFNAIFIASLEFVGGLCLVFGLATRIFAGLLSCSMLVALITSDGQEWLQKFPADITDVTSFTYLLFLIWLVLYGPGPISIDKLLSKWLHIGGKTGSASAGAL